MEDKEPAEKHETSSLIESFLSAKHPITRERVSELGEPDIRKLGQIAIGEVPGVTRGARSKALFAVSYLGDDQSSEILNTVLTNSREDGSLRTIAATNLARLPTEYAEPKLVANLKVKDDSIRNEVIKSLGRIGDIKALKALDEISSVEQPDFVQRQLRFSKALISYRLGLDREDLPSLETLRGPSAGEGNRIVLKMSPVDRQHVRKALQALERTPYNVGVNNDFGFELHAGKASWVLLLNEKTAETNLLSSLSAYRMIAGFLSRYIEETDTYAVQYVVLTRPYNGSIEVKVVRTDGEVFYAGRAEIHADEMGFTIVDVEHPGTASTEVKGKLSHNNIEFEVLNTFGKRQKKRTTAQFDMSKIRG